jgi:hypothetical protein
MPPGEFWIRGMRNPRQRKCDNCIIPTDIIGYVFKEEFFRSVLDPDERVNSGQMLIPG